MAADLTEEIAALRAQIEALSKQIPTKPDPDVSMNASEAIESLLGVPSDTVDKIKDQIEGFIELLGQQMHEIPAGTALAIFALGVVFGRVLSR
jgi:hypothetical protein